MSQVIPMNDRPHILIVDDEANICLSVEKALKRRGYEVAQALCVSDALNLLREGPAFDLIIADLMIPQAGGLELLKQVREGWSQTPVLIITGYASIASAVEATRRGAAGCLAKPFTPEELAKAVEESLGQAMAEESAADPLPPAGPIDVDMPFDAREVARATSPRFVERLTRSDVTVALTPIGRQAAADICSLGQRSCKRLVTKGMCKQPECPIVAAEKKNAAKRGHLLTFVPDPIDVDLPFSRREVASAAGDAYMEALGRSDMPNLGYWRSSSAARTVPKVLVVDDEPVVVNSIRRTLLRRAYKVDEAFSGRDAVRRVESGNYDLVLLDMRLPDANGLDLISDLRKRRPQLRIVIVTGYASIDTAVEAIRKGATDYMAKPFTPEELYSVAQRTLQRAVA